MEAVGRRAMRKTMAATRRAVVEAGGRRATMVMERQASSKVFCNYM